MPNPNPDHTLQPQEKKAEILSQAKTAAPRPKRVNKSDTPPGKLILYMAKEVGRWLGVGLGLGLGFGVEVKAVWWIEFDTPRKLIILHGQGGRWLGVGLRGGEG